MTRQTDTAIAVYRELEPTLSPRQAFVRVLLRQFRDAYGAWPTAKELLRYATATYAECKQFDPNSIRPRLFELNEQGYAAKGPTRRCAVTAKVVYTWVLTRPQAPTTRALDPARQMELL